MNHAESIGLKPGQVVDVILLGAAERCFVGRVNQVCGQRVGLEVPWQLAAGQALRIEAGDEAFLGEVAGCTAGPGTQLASVELDQVLTGLSTLARMLRRFDGEASGIESLNTVQNRSNQNHQQS